MVSYRGNRSQYQNPLSKGLTVLLATLESTLDLSSGGKNGHIDHPQAGVN